MKVLDYNSIKWDDHFYLDTSSPSGIRWNRCVFRGRNYTILVKTTGDIAGTNPLKTNKQRRGWSVGLDGLSYSVNRIIWVMLYGYLSPEMVIDHLDGNPFNNVHSNLKLKTPRANFQNKKMYNNNTSGYVGVQLRTRGGLGIWQAEWYDLEKIRHFSRYHVKDHGYEFAKLCAIHKRKSMLESLNLEGMSYTERHGVSKG